MNRVGCCGRRRRFPPPRTVLARTPKWLPYSKNSALPARRETSHHTRYVPTVIPSKLRPYTRSRPSVVGSWDPDCRRRVSRARPVINLIGVENLAGNKAETSLQVSWIIFDAGVMVVVCLRYERQKRARGGIFGPFLLPTGLQRVSEPTRLPQRFGLLLLLANTGYIPLSDSLTG